MLYVEICTRYIHIFYEKCVLELVNVSFHHVNAHCGTMRLLIELERRCNVYLVFQNTPDFISPLIWPRIFSDLNPVDYEVWRVLQRCLYRTRIRDVDHLKRRLVEEWRHFSQDIIDRAVRQWC